MISTVFQRGMLLKIFFFPKSHQFFLLQIVSTVSGKSESRQSCLNSNVQTWAPHSFHPAGVNELQAVVIAALLTLEILYILYKNSGPILFLTRWSNRSCVYVNDPDTEAGGHLHTFSDFKSSLIGAFGNVTLDSSSFSCIKWKITWNRQRNIYSMPVEFSLQFKLLNCKNRCRRCQDWWCCFAGGGNWRLRSHLFSVTQSLGRTERRTRLTENIHFSLLLSPVSALLTVNSFFFQPYLCLLVLLCTK